MLRELQRTEPGGKRVLDRVLDIFDALEEVPQLSVTEVARRLGVDKSTASRQLAALARRDYLARDPITGHFRLGIRLLRLGNVVSGRLNLRNLALPIMTRLRDATGETVSLVMRHGLKRVYVEMVESPQLVRRIHEVGLLQDLYPGAPGKLFLAYMPPSEARQILESMGPVRLASGAIADPGAVERELQEIQVAGAAWAQDERVAGAAAAAFPVFDQSGEVAAALSVSMPTSRVTPEHRARCIEYGQAAAAEISRSLGYIRSGPGPSP